jgi:uncharacterized protein YigE (DUF2233 family)
MSRRGLLLAVLAVSAVAAIAGLRRAAVADARRFTVIEVDTRTEELALSLDDAQGQPFGTFARLRARLAAQGRQLAFAMNAGMYHPDRRPVGLLVIDGRELAPLNLHQGAGNFFLQPNGVFALTARGPVVVASTDYPRLRDVRLATQSGPLLVHGGAIHPGFDPDSRSRRIRNGVCARGDQAVFVISEVPVNLHEFARHFRDTLGCTEALYLDGVVSSLYSPRLHRDDRRDRLGPIIAVVAPAQAGSAPR